MHVVEYRALKSLRLDMNAVVPRSEVWDGEGALITAAGLLFRLCSGIVNDDFCVGYERSGGVSSAGKRGRVRLCDGRAVNAEEARYDEDQYEA